MSRMFARRGLGFTLIELLIVVAIIGILAAIAIPNFLEAQVRAKVARSVADMKALATALEIYYVDQNAYPWAQLHRTWPSMSARIKQLTSPVQYISSIPPDPFVPTNMFHGSGFLVDTFDYFDCLSDWADLSLFGSRWRLCSCGPDRFQGWGVDPQRLGPLPYDSSNGTINDGDIVTLEGGRSVYDGWLKFPCRP